MRTSLATMPPIRTACTTAYATHLVVSATPCQVLRVYASIKHDASNAVYYLQVIDSSAPVNAGGAITLLSVREINHKQNETELYVLDFAAYGVRCASGCVVQLSTTIGIGTLDGANLLASAEYI
jgi:hypothetical protein